MLLWLWLLAADTAPLGVIFISRCDGVAFWEIFNQNAHVLCARCSDGVFFCSVENVATLLCRAWTSSCRLFPREGKILGTRDKSQPRAVKEWTGSAQREAANGAPRTEHRVTRSSFLCTPFESMVIWFVNNECGNEHGQENGQSINSNEGHTAAHWVRCVGRLRTHRNWFDWPCCSLVFPTIAYYLQANFTFNSKIFQN